MLIAYGFRALYPVVWVGTKNGVAFSFCEILATVNPTLNAGRTAQTAIRGASFGHQRRVSQVEG